MPKTTEDFRQEWMALAHKAYSAVQAEGIETPDAPSYRTPKLPTNLSERSDRDLIDFMVRYARWSDYFSAQTTMEEINESTAEAAVRRLENLYMLNHRPEKPQSGELTMIKAEMDNDAEIVAARDAQRIIYARRKLMKMLLEHTERDGALCSRELTRRTDGSDLERRSNRRIA